MSSTLGKVIVLVVLSVVPGMVLAAQASGVQATTQPAPKPRNIDEAKKIAAEMEASAEAAAAAVTAKINAARDESRKATGKEAEQVNARIMELANERLAIGGRANQEIVAFWENLSRRPEGPAEHPIARANIEPDRSSLTADDVSFKRRLLADAARAKGEATDRSVQGMTDEQVIDAIVKDGLVTPQMIAAQRAKLWDEVDKASQSRQGASPGAERSPSQPVVRASPRSRAGQPQPRRVGPTNSASPAGQSGQREEQIRKAEINLKSDGEIAQGLFAEISNFRQMAANARQSAQAAAVRAANQERERQQREAEKLPEALRNLPQDPNEAAVVVLWGYAKSMHLSKQAERAVENAGAMGQSKKALEYVDDMALLLDQAKAYKQRMNGMDQELLRKVRRFLLTSDKLADGEKRALLGLDL